MNTAKHALSPPNTVRKQMLESTNPEEVRAIMAGYCCDHKLTVVDTGKLKFRQTRHLLSTAELCEIEYGATVKIEYEDLKSYYTISLPSSGEQLLALGSHRTHSDINCGMVISPSQTVSLEMSGNCRKFLVRILRKKLESTLQRLLGRRIDRPLLFESSMDMDFGASSSWWRTVKFFLAEQERNGSIYHQWPFLETVEQTLIEGLLWGQPHNYTQALEQKERTALPAFVYRAETFIRENAHKPITKEDILSVAGVPGRTLYEGFKRFGKSSPMRYLKETRMDRVRQDLLSCNGDATITDIATRWWFMHLGRFSIEYKERFGEPPSETLKKSIISD